MEYSGDEPPRVRLTDVRDGVEWLLSIQDDGISIDPNHGDRIFQVFERLHGNDGHPGTGIVLTV